MKPEAMPSEQQSIEVTLDDQAWQPATYRRGEFVDIYGLPLDLQKISSWRPAEKPMNPDDASDNARANSWRWRSRRA